MRLIQTVKNIDKKKLVILICWALINIFFLLKNGIITTGESDKYISQAKIFIETGHLSSKSLEMYFTQIALLAFCLKFHLSFFVAIIVQLFFNLISTFCFYEILLRIFKSSKIALTGTLILLLNYPYQEFNGMLQTESLFYSFTLILSCYVLSIENLSLKKIFTIIFLLLTVIITRPTGLLFIPPVFFYLFIFFSGEINIAKRMAIAFVAICLFIVILNNALGSGGEFDFMLPFKNEDIICGTPTLLNPAPIKISSTGNSLYGLIFYIKNNFGQFARLAWLKTVAFFGLYRSYFSSWHNIYLISLFYPLYIMAIASLSYWRKSDRKIFIYLLSSILVVWLTVMLTCDDWHNRFYLGISPYIIIASLGLIKKISAK